MTNNFYKTIIFFLFVFLLLSSRGVSALVLTATESITITAEVVEDSGTGTSGGGGSRGGGTIFIPKTSVRFSGEAYPDALVTILENGIERASLTARTDGYFEITLEETYNTSTLYTLFAKDREGNKSLLLNYPIVIYAGYLTYISGIRFAPTISTDKIEVKAGDYLTVFGNALPNKNIEITIGGDENKQVFTLDSKEDGSYKTILPLLDLPKGDYFVHANYIDDTRISKLVKFTIGDTNISSTEAVANLPGDCNADRTINLIDFSILAFWYNKHNPPACVDTNKDGTINLIDFSILAFYWTG